MNSQFVGWFIIMYDKILRFNIINGYKFFKYFKCFLTIVCNNRGFVEYKFFNGVGNIIAINLCY